MIFPVSCSLFLMLIVILFYCLVIVTLTQFSNRLFIVKMTFCIIKIYCIVLYQVLLVTYVIIFLQDQYFFAYKQAKRRDDDIAIVNCAANVTMEPNSKTINTISLAYGGMAPTTVLAVKTREKMKGK